MTKEGHTEDGVALGEKGERERRKNPVRCTTFSLKFNIFFETQETQGSVATDLHCVCSHYLVILKQDNLTKNTHMILRYLKMHRGWHMIPECLPTLTKVILRLRSDLCLTAGWSLKHKQRQLLLLALPSHSPSAAHQWRPSAYSTWQWLERTQWWR